MTANKIEINPQDVQAYLSVLEPFLPDASYSAYGIHTVLNQILVANGRDKIRPQMMYNYARNGLVVQGEKIFGTSLRAFTNGEVAQFIIRYCVRNGIKITFEATTVTEDPNQLVLDLNI